METKTKNILIISPHPDDDVIGMGGTIAIKAKEGAHFTILYATNGGGSIKTDEYKHLSKEELIKLRKEESKKSLEPLLDDTTVAEQKFLGLESATLFTTPELFTREIELILRSKNYDEVYIPYFKDKHPTHKAVAELSTETIKRGPFKVELYAYETWNPLPIEENTVVVDISKYYKNKLAAVSCHRSQCSITPFDEGIIAKNRYNAVFQQVNSKNKMDYAELFLRIK
jgi:LmbE family N-acetylglucosaminyl deacetylase